MNGKEDREGFSRRKFIKGISMAAGQVSSITVYK
jgi:hypothetical protein